MGESIVLALLGAWSSINGITRPWLAVCLSGADPIGGSIKLCIAIGQSFIHNESVATSATKSSFILIHTKTETAADTRPIRLRNDEAYNAAAADADRLRWLISRQRLVTIQRRRVDFCAFWAVLKCRNRRRLRCTDTSTFYHQFIVSR